MYMRKFIEERNVCIKKHLLLEGVFLMQTTLYSSNLPKAHV